MLRGRRDRLHRLGLLIPLTSPASRRRSSSSSATRRRAKSPTTSRPSSPAMECIQETGARPDRVHRRHLHRRRGEGGDRDPRPRLVAGRLQHRHRGDRAERHPRRRTAAGEHAAAPLLRRDGRDRLALLLLGLWLRLVWWRRRDIPATPWFLRAVAVSGAARSSRSGAGWIVTEVGRQPWIVQGYMRTAEAVTEAEGIWFAFAGVLRRSTRRWAPAPSSSCARCRAAGARRGRAAGRGALRAPGGPWAGVA